MGKREVILIIGCLIFLYGFSPQNRLEPDMWKLVGFLILGILYLNRNK